MTQMVTKEDLLKSNTKKSRANKIPNKISGAEGKKLNEFNL